MDLHDGTRTTHHDEDCLVGGKEDVKRLPLSSLNLTQLNHPIQSDPIHHHYPFSLHLSLEIEKKVSHLEGFNTPHPTLARRWTQKKAQGKNRRWLWLWTTGACSVPDPVVEPSGDWSKCGYVRSMM